MVGQMEHVRGIRNGLAGVARGAADQATAEARWAVRAKVWDDGAVACRVKDGKDFVPGSRRIGPAVDEKDGFPGFGAGELVGLFNLGSF